jgi:CheY-like chemotaxis protein
MENTPGPSSSLQGKRIFIIEDNAANMAIAKTLLERHGAIVAFERWGNTVKERLTEFATVDLIVLDLMLANGLSGYDLFTQIHAMPGFEQIPIVACSASDPSEAIPRVRNMGFVGYIAKPINYDAFAFQIENILNGDTLWITR